MKPRWLTASLAVTVTLAMAGGVLVPARANLPVGSEEDVVAPELRSFSIAPTTVDVRTAAQTVTATARLTDDLSGVQSLQVLYRSPSMSQHAFLNFSPSSRVSGTALDGLYETTFQFDTQREAGTWSAVSVSTRDSIGNQRDYTPAQAAALGVVALEVLSNRDSVSPTITAFRIVPSSLDLSGADRRAVVEFDVTDAGGAGVASVFAAVLSPSGRQRLTASMGTGQLVAGTPDGGTMRGSVLTSTSTPTGNYFEEGVSQFSEPGTWTLQQAQVYDGAGNRTNYLGADAAALYSGLTVTSDPTDTGLPGVTAYRFAPQRLDVTDGPATVTVEFDVTDDLSGVQAAWLRFRSPSVAGASPPFVERSAVHHHYLGSPRVTDGTLTASVTFPRFDRAGNWTVHEVCAVDRVKRQRCYSGAALQGRGPTQVTVVVNEAPSVSVTGVQEGATYPAGSAPTPGCRVVDPEDGTINDVAAVVAGPDADGRFTATCSYTDQGGRTSTHTVRYVVEHSTADPDSDGDGLSDVIEIWLGCDPHDADSDDDGLNDWIEIIIGTDPNAGDSDDDGEGDNDYLLRVIYEKCGCRPGLDEDANGNGVLDVIEYWLFGGLYDPDRHGGGGYTLIEYVYHRCGCGPEPDGHGIPGMVKKYWGGGRLLRYIVHCGCTPWDDESGSGFSSRFLLVLGGAGDDDTDGDGIIDVIEILIGCNPGDDDTDGDGLSDRLELFHYGTDPLDEDTDGDGLLDKIEIDLGCDPNDADSDGDGLLDGDDPAPRGAILTDSCGPDGGAVVPLGTAVTGRAEFVGYNGGVRTGSIDWGDGTPRATRSGAGALTASHTYAAPGVYVIGCHVIDVNGGTQSTEYRYVVVYDPKGGFVTGGGWIESPAGAYASEPDLTGRASFGFVSKYQPGRSTPSGSTEFQLRAAGFNFHSAAYEWLVVSGANAQYRGTGSVNGVPGYRFVVTVVDGAGTAGGGTDKFRIKIWDANGVVYDNMRGSDDALGRAQPLSSGSIVIHNR